MKPGDRWRDEYLRRQVGRLPVGLRGSMQWLLSPRGRLLRIPASVLFIAGGFLWFLPVVGFWMLPLGLLLLSEEVPALKRPLVRTLLRLEKRRRRRMRG